MASTVKEKKNSKKYYEKHRKYREEKIAKVIAKQKNDPDKYADYQRDYYHKNSKYRKYKQEYSKEYKKREPIKSLPKSKRKAYR